MVAAFELALANNAILKIRRTPMLSKLTLFAIALSAFAQTRPSITATGEGTVSASPDQATISVSVTTAAPTAIEAGNLNASQTSAVISALRAVLNSSDSLKTVSYSLNPNYSNAGNLTGYTATNTIQVTTADLASTGKLIDTATQSGATRVQSLSFGLKDSQPLRAQALKLASAQAQTQVAAIAAGLNVKLGNVIAASDGSTVSPLTTGFPGLSATITPIVTGAVQVSASVRLQVEIVP